MVGCVPVLNSFSANPYLYSSSEFNYVRNAAGECVLVQGASSLPSDDSCSNGEDYWYERTPYRKIPYSSCEGGDRIDRGPTHACPGLKGHGFFFWLFVLFVPVTLAALVGYWVYRRSGLARGYATVSSVHSSHTHTNHLFLSLLLSPHRNAARSAFPVQNSVRHMRHPASQACSTRSRPCRGTLLVYSGSRGRRRQARCHLYSGAGEGIDMCP